MELSELGLKRADFENDVFQVWPENWKAFLIFEAMSDQWRVGPNGPYALDYSALSEVWARYKIPEDAKDEIFQLIREMVPAALKAIRDRADAK